MHVIACNSPRELQHLMREACVDPYGIRIMVPKAIHRLVKFTDLPVISANILKQEMLSLGADVAIARGSLTGSVKKTDGLIMGDLSQYRRLIEKLKCQPFGLREFALRLQRVLENFEKGAHTFSAGKYSLTLGRSIRIMGIINVTPDSFSADGLLGVPIERIARIAEEKVAEGADCIDIGAESSRPGARPVSAREQMRRLLPVVKILAKKVKAPISVDTHQPDVAAAALGAGASIINDISGLRDARMAKLIGRSNAGIIIMHMLGTPRTMQKNPVYTSLISQIYDFLSVAVERALDAGIKKEQIMIDPGIGFGKTADHNFEIIRRLSEFRSLGTAVMIGASRKSCIGSVTKQRPQERLNGSLAAAVLAAAAGADMVRVHDVRQTKEALSVADKVLKN